MTDPVWRLIKTAPKDQTPVDIWVDGERFPNYRRIQDGATLYEPIYCGRSIVEPTHWMPIPGDPS